MEKEPKTPLGREIYRRMKKLGLNQKSLPLKAGLNETYLRDIFDGKSKNPRSKHLDQLAVRGLGCTAGDLLKAVASVDGDSEDWHPSPDLPPDVLPEHQAPFGSSEIKMVKLDEVNVVAGNSLSGATHPSESMHYNHERVIAQWEVPADMIGRLRVSEGRLKIITAKGLSNAPFIQPGDKLMIDIGDQHPSPGGMFAIFDGVGEAVKQIEVVPYSDPPRVILKSLNPEFDAREIPLSTLLIAGRMVGKWMWS